MDKTNWQLIKAHFEELLTLSPQEQQDWLARQAKSDPKTAAKLEQMLAADGDDSSKITRAVSTNIDQLYQQNFNHQEGEVIGGYKIEKLIGKGGMGVVFAASRSDKAFEQKVAIKLIQSQSITPDSIRRFESERQILANLNHPNIAHLIDGGTTQKGIPFLVMEFIEGVPILDYCIGKQLNLSERIELFLQVCSAVSYAHQNLIIHRDIKPSNVLVNNEGQIKLLDFGIAKILNPESYQQDVVNTQAEMRLLSLENASPEQITGDAITTQTDVYSLGNLLYQLLTEETLFQVAKKTRLNLERAICETQPIKPSVAITAKISTVTDGSKERLKNFGKRIKGDLDTITLKALKKSPNARYKTVEQFSEDIIRYLNNYPITARPESFIYLFTQFVRRNKAIVSVSFVLIISILFFSLSLSIKSVQLEYEKRKAIEESELAKQTTDFLIDIFSASDPDVHAGNDLTASILLIRGKENVQQLKPSILKATMFETLATVSQRRGDYDRVESMLNESLKLKLELPDIEFSELALTHYKLGDYYTEMSNFELAEEMLLKSIKLFNEDKESNRRQLISANVLLADNYADQGHLKKAAKFYSDYLEFSISEYTIDSIQVSDAYAKLGQFQRDLGNFQEAEAYLRKSLSLSLDIVGEIHSQSAHRMNQLASSLIQNKKYDEALKHAENGLRIRKKIHKKDHLEVGASYGIISRIYSQKGELEKAIQYREQSTNLVTRMMGEEHVYALASSLSLTKLLIKNKQVEAAETLLLKTLEIARKTGHLNNPKMSDILVLLGNMSLKHNNYFETKSYYREALDIRREHLPRDHWRIGEAYEKLGLLYYKQQNYVVAKANLEQALKILSLTFDRDDSRVKNLREKLINVDSFISDESTDSAQL